MSSAIKKRKLNITSQLLYFYYSSLIEFRQIVMNSNLITIIKYELWISSFVKNTLLLDLNDGVIDCIQLFIRIKKLI